MCVRRDAGQGRGPSQHPAARGSELSATRSPPYCDAALLHSSALCVFRLLLLDCSFGHPTAMGVSLPSTPSAIRAPRVVPRWSVRSIIQQMCGGLLSGLLVLLRTLSYAFLVYAGPLAVHQSAATAGMILSSAIAQLIYLVRKDQMQGQIASSSSAFAPVLAAMLNSIHSDLSEANEATRHVAAFGIPLLVCLFVAVCMYLLARYRLGKFLQYVPFSMSRGFFCIVGLAMVLGGVKLATRDVDLATLDSKQWRKLRDPARLVQLATAAAIVAVLSVAKRKFSHRLLVFPSVVLCCAAACYLGLFVAFGAVGPARDHGWLFSRTGSTDDSGSERFYRFYSNLDIWRADVSLLFSSLGSHWVEVLLLAFVASLDMALNLPALASMSAEDNRPSFDADLEFKTAAVSVAVAGTLGVGCSYLTLSPTKINREAGGVLGPLSSAVCAALLFACYVAGPDLLYVLCPQFLGGVLAFAGFDYCLSGLWDSRHLMQRWECVGICAMMLLSLLKPVGPSYAIILGGAAACLVFVYQFMRASKPGTAVLYADAAMDEENTPAAEEAAALMGIPRTQANLAFPCVLVEESSVASTQLAPLTRRLWQRSGDLRSSAAQRRLDRSEFRVATLRLSGFLYFGNVSLLSETFAHCMGPRPLSAANTSPTELEADRRRPRVLLLDFTDCIGMDSAALEQMHAGLLRAVKHRLTVAIAGLQRVKGPHGELPNSSSPLVMPRPCTPAVVSMHRGLAKIGLFTPKPWLHLFDSRAQALSWIEGEYVLQRQQRPREENRLVIHQAKASSVASALELEMQPLEPLSPRSTTPRSTHAVQVHALSINAAEDDESDSEDIAAAPVEQQSSPRSNHISDLASIDWAAFASVIQLTAGQTLSLDDAPPAAADDELSRFPRSEDDAYVLMYVSSGQLGLYLSEQARVDLTETSLVVREEASCKAPPPFLTQQASQPELQSAASTGLSPTATPFDSPDGSPNAPVTAAPQPGTSSVLGSMQLGNGLHPADSARNSLTQPMGALPPPALIMQPQANSTQSVLVHMTAATAKVGQESDADLGAAASLPAPAVAPAATATAAAASASASAPVASAPLDPSAEIRRYHAGALFAMSSLSLRAHQLHLVAVSNSHAHGDASTNAETRVHLVRPSQISEMQRLSPHSAAMLSHQLALQSLATELHAANQTRWSRPDLH